MNSGASWLPDGKTGDEGRLLNGEDPENMSGRELVLLAVALLLDGARRGRARFALCVGSSRLFVGDITRELPGLDDMCSSGQEEGIRTIVSRFSEFSAAVDWRSKEVSAEDCGSCEDSEDSESVDSVGACK